MNTSLFAFLNYSKSQKLFCFALIATTLLASTASKAIAATSSASSENTQPILIAQSNLVQITGLSTEINGSELEVTIETFNDEILLIDASLFVVEGDRLIATIENSALNNGAILLENPTSDISTIEVVALTESSSQIIVTGVAGNSPTTNITLISGGLAYALNPDTTDTTQELIVTGEGEESYVARTSTTATRTDTPIRDTPQSIQVIPQEIFEDQAALNISDVIRNASGVVLGEKEPRGQRFQIRGFGSASVLRDGFRLTSGGTGNIGYPELGNIQSIEVLKGPASILFGNVEPGGVINLVTEQPLAEEQVELGVRLGNRTLFSPSLDVTGPLNDTGSVRYRLNALFRTQDYYRDFDTDISRIFFAPSLAFDIGDRTDLTFNLEYNEDTRPSDFGLVVLPGDDEVADVPFDRALNDRDDEANAEFFRAGYNLEHRFTEDFKLRNSFYTTYYDTRYFGAIGNPFAPTGGALQANGDLSLLPFYLAQPSTTYEVQTNAEWDFSTGSIKHKVLAGFDLARRNQLDNFSAVNFVGAFDFNIFNPVYGLPIRPDPDAVSATNPFSLLAIDNDFESRSFGVYLQDQIDFSDKFKFLAGIRYESVEQTNTNRPTLVNNFAPTTVETREDDAWTPRVGLVYQPNDVFSLYGSYSRSFSPNTQQTVNGEFLESEKGEQFEVGARAELLDGDLVATVALFNLKKQNVAVPDPVFPQLGSVAVGEQRTRGIELDVIGEISDGWNIVANYAYIDAEITDDNFDANGNTNEGNTIFGVPEHNINLWTTYEVQRGSLAGLTIGGGLNFISERFGDNANSFTVDPYTTVNALIAYEKNNWRAALNFRNIFDVDFIESVANNRNTEIIPGEGFTMIGSLEVEF